jgi:hypothetical protein
MATVTVGTGTVGTRFVRNDYPMEAGTTAGTTKLEGKQINLVPTHGSLVSKRNSIEG